MSADLSHTQILNALSTEHGHVHIFVISLLLLMDAEQSLTPNKFPFVEASFQACAASRSCVALLRGWQC